jgi:hypothetical protein
MYVCMRVWKYVNIDVCMHENYIDFPCLYSFRIYLFKLNEYILPKSPY